MKNLRNHKRVTYSGLMLSGKLKEQIEEVDRQAEELFSQLVEQMKQAEGVTEQLKATEEIVKSEVVFALLYSNTYGTGTSIQSKNSSRGIKNTKTCFALRQRIRKDSALLYPP